MHSHDLNQIDRPQTLDTVFSTCRVLPVPLGLSTEPPGDLQHELIQLQAQLDTIQLHMTNLQIVGIIFILKLPFICHIN